MILEFGKKQYECLHKSWKKEFDGFEEYWKCTDCGATNETPTDEKKSPTPIPEYMKAQRVNTSHKDIEALTAQITAILNGEALRELKNHLPPPYLIPDGMIEAILDLITTHTERVKLEKDIKYHTLKARYQRMYLGGDEDALSTKRYVKTLKKRLKTLQKGTNHV